MRAGLLLLDDGRGPDGLPSDAQRLQQSDSLQQEQGLSRWPLRERGELLPTTAGLHGYLLYCLPHDSLSDSGPVGVEPEARHRLAAELLVVEVEVRYRLAIQVDLGKREFR
jgi:hypothetical protein